MATQRAVEISKLRSQMDDISRQLENLQGMGQVEYDHHHGLHDVNGMDWGLITARFKTVLDESDGSPLKWGVLIQLMGIGWEPNCGKGHYSCRSKLNRVWREFEDGHPELCWDYRLSQITDEMSLATALYVRVGPGTYRKWLRG